MKNPLSNGRIVGKNDDYLKRDFRRGDASYPMSRSDLMDFATCPRKWRRGVKSEDRSTSTDWGNLIDTLLMEPHKFEKRFAIKPPVYLDKEGEPKKFNANAKSCKDWIAAQGEKLCISQSDYDFANEAVERLKSEPDIAEFLGAAKFQVFIEAVYEDTVTGLTIPIRCLLDVLPTSPRYARAIGDLKTAQSACLTGWNRVVERYSYHVQAAMYLDAHNAINPDDQRDEFHHIIQESEPPFETATPMMSEDMLDLGRKRYTSALRLYAFCLKENKWPGYNEIFEGTKIRGVPLVEPEAYMILNAPANDDPDWISEPKAA